MNASRTNQNHVEFDHFLKAAKRLGLTREEQARLLGISRSALLRRLKGAKLRPSEVEVLGLLPGALEQAAVLLGSEWRALQWLTSPALAFGKKRPVDLLDTPGGYKEVLATLEEAVYGFY